MNRKYRHKHPQASDSLTRRRFIQTSTAALAGAALVPPLMRADSQSADAVLPAGMNLDWEKTSVVAENTKRSRVSLDGIWRFTPAIEGSKESPQVGWGYAKVPGSWGGDKGGDRRGGLYGEGTAPALLARGSGPQWVNYEGLRLTSAWYERQAPIPADWQGRTIRLRCDRLSTDAIIYVNGKECGRISWPWGSVDITGAVTPGQTADIDVRVAAIPDSEDVGLFDGNASLANVTYSAATLATRGLTGSIYLESLSSVAHVSDVFVRTSTRGKNIALDVDLDGVTQAGRVHFIADMLNEKGVMEKSFRAIAPVEVKPTQTVTISWGWTNPRLWDVDQPNLYTLRLRVSGAGLQDEFDQPFGFRDFWVEGRQFYLNGTVIHLRQPCHGPLSLGQVGDNFSEFGIWKVDTRGDDSDAGPQLDHADRIGYLAAVFILDANKYMRDPNGKSIWEQHQKLHAMTRTAIWMRHYRNHPSAVMWIAGFNLFMNSVNLDPRHVGRRGWGQSDEHWRQFMAQADEMFAGLKKLDPTRAYFSHEGTYTGDVYSMNNYLDLMPLQEREEWLIEWAKSGEMPITMTEFGTPMDCTFRRGRKGYEQNENTEPLLTEYATIYFGADAYTSEEPDYRQYIRGLFRGGMLYDIPGRKFEQFTDNSKIQLLFRKNTWCSWRTAGLSGGLRTWSHSQLGLKELNYPTLAWIAGPTDDYTAKDHQFRSGQKFQKQIVLINDMRQPQDFIANWTATVGGKQVGSGELHGTLAVSEIRKVPFELTAPPLEASGKADGRITLTVSIAKATHHDSFEFRIYGSVQHGSGDIATVDREGLAGRLLANLGYQPQAWSGANAPLVVIGRNGLKNDPTLAARLEPYVRGGGRVLIFAQDPDWMIEALGWRVCPYGSRYVFPIQNSPVTQDIDEEDLRNWTGSSTLVPAYPEYIGKYLRSNWVNLPYSGWHWGNRGAVSSAAIEKPHRSGWTPLLECEFDLAYTPLMELNYGQGRLMVCTLDLEDHVALDPAARLMAGQIVAYALRAPLAPRVSKVAYLGGAMGAAWLNKIGVSFERVDALDTNAELVLIGPDAKLDTAAFNGYLGQGGKLFFLPRAQASGCLGATLKPAADDFAGSLSAPDWAEAKGLSASDLRWRTCPDNPPWILSGGVEIGADGLLGRKTVGKGIAIFCQIDPDRFDADQKTYFRYTRWRSTRAVAQLLANLGASFSVDGRIFHPLETKPNPNSMWIGPAGDRSGLSCEPRPPSDLSDPVNTRVGYYCPDYRTDFDNGDNPYRYWRW